MERLWAPWRMEYISGSSGDGGCIFCDYPTCSDPAASLILRKDPRTFVIMNRYPYTNGHLMTAPLRHVNRLEQLTPDEMLELMQNTARCTSALTTAIGAQQFNVGINLGKAAGAGIAGHLHIHIVPRWEGDTNFMTVLGDVRVIPESLEATYLKLLPHFSRD